MARKQTHMMKLCMVLSASESDKLIINENHILMAENILQGVEGDMLKVFNSIGKPVTTRHMDDILATMRVHRVLEKPELWRIAMTSMSVKEFNDAVDGLIQANYLCVRNELGAMKIYYTKTDDDEIEEKQREEVQRNAYRVI